jgi:hypothetical protein
MDRKRWSATVVVAGALGLSVGSAVAAPVDVQLDGDDANGDYLAVSHGGDAYAGGLGVAVSTTGCATVPYGLVAVSGTGCADAATLAVSGAGPAGYGNPACGGAPGCADVSISGTDCATSVWVAVSGTGCTQSGVALSGTGDAHGYQRWDTGHVGLVPDPVGVAVSGTGNADGGVIAVAPDGTADASTGTVWVLDVPVAVLGVAVAGGDATANGGLLAVSATGEANGAFVNVDQNP